jgi:hypothetical protein
MAFLRLSTLFLESAGMPLYDIEIEIISGSINELLMLLV